MKLPCVYILASKQFGTIYVGVTSNLHRRMAEHSQGLLEGFTKKYSVKCLVYFELHQTLPDPIHREKQLKAWRRRWKVRLVEQSNPEWHNLFDETTGEIRCGPADVHWLSRAD
ncbi:GIY-YIG nuclease family protein [Hyphomicrobium sp.]|uniref:GIY-YIG nuclease family protein n=1 Tax=Hyphomicrobium sp. TaxID=82 RepID=UPI003F725BF4